MPAPVAYDAPAGGARPGLLARRAIARIVLGLVVAAGLIIWLGRFTDIDLILADAVFDRGANVFPWREAWLADTFTHRILKVVLTVAAASVVLAAVADLIRPRARFTHAFRLRLRLVALAALAVPLVISTLKQQSDAHCPWDLARYGGTEPYVRLFQALPHGVLPGHCLPGGHAATALWLLALAVFWLPHAPRKALAVAGAALVFGAAVGWMQQLRGAHFLTHTLWSMWLAVAVVLALVIVLQGWAQRHRGSGPVLVADELENDLAGARQRRF
jgi:membrane-associated PAP2 superfamily phosphatase